jgi:hypothetical protein
LLPFERQPAFLCRNKTGAEYQRGGHAKINFAHTPIRRYAVTGEARMDLQLKSRESENPG